MGSVAQRDRVGVHCLLVDPARVWRDPIRPFTDDGDPLFELLGWCRRVALPSAGCAFLAEGCVIHRGRSTLAVVAATDDRSNRFHEWATDRHEPHFGRVPGATKHYDALVAAFKNNVPHLTSSELATACRPQRAAR